MNGGRPKTPTVRPMLPKTKPGVEPARRRKVSLPLAAGDTVTSHSAPGMGATFFIIHDKDGNTKTHGILPADAGYEQVAESVELDLTDDGPGPGEGMPPSTDV